MADETSQESTRDEVIPADAPSESSFTPSWKLPDGIESHIEAGIINAAAGMAVGGVAGLMLFRPGGGYRVASIAAGLGVALGSTFERYKQS